MMKQWFSEFNDEQKNFITQRLTGKTLWDIMITFLFQILYFQTKTITFFVPLIPLYWTSDTENWKLGWTLPLPHHLHALLPRHGKTQ